MAAVDLFVIFAPLFGRKAGNGFFIDLYEVGLVNITASGRNYRGGYVAASVAAQGSAVGAIIGGANEVM